MIWKEKEKVTRIADKLSGTMKEKWVSLLFVLLFFCKGPCTICVVNIIFEKFHNSISFLIFFSIEVASDEQKMIHLNFLYIFHRGK